MELPWQNANPTFPNHFWTAWWKVKGSRPSPPAKGRKEVRWPQGAWERERLVLLPFSVPSFNQAIGSKAQNTARDQIVALC